jgi:hypothetical protein
MSRGALEHCPPTNLLDRLSRIESIPSQNERLATVHSDRADLEPRSSSAIERVPGGDPHNRWLTRQPLIVRLLHGDLEHRTPPPYRGSWPPWCRRPRPP